MTSTGTNFRKRIAAKGRRCTYCGFKVWYGKAERALFKTKFAAIAVTDRQTNIAVAERMLTADHIVPLSEGGNPIDPNNGAVSCVTCNSMKADFPERDARRVISKLVNNAGHPHQVFMRTGVFMRPTGQIIGKKDE